MFKVEDLQGWLFKLGIPVRWHRAIFWIAGISIIATLIPRLGDLFPPYQREPSVGQKEVSTEPIKPSKEAPQTSINHSTLPHGNPGDPETRVITTPASTPPSGPSDSPPSPPPAPPPTGAPLGRALSPIASEACRTPLSATGSAWQVGRVVMSDRNYERAYFCNLYSAGVGSLDFVLGNSYRELRVTIGTADDSDWLKHRVKFEIIGDDKVYLAKTLEFGETRDLTVNVMGISRLKLNITELGPGTSDSPSRPVWASPIAIPRS